MNHHYRVGVIDSGAGGAYLEQLIRERFSTEIVTQIVRYQPELFESYSNISLQKLCILCQEHVDYICQDFIPDIIIVACMTLSSNCLEFIKSIVPDNVIVLDMITCLPYLHNNTTIFGTPNTINSGRFSYCVEIPCAKLSTVIEEDNLNHVIKVEILNAVNKLNLTVTSTILLGCSHYSIVKELFQELFNPVEIIDPLELILEKLKYIVEPW